MPTQSASHKFRSDRPRTAQRGLAVSQFPYASTFDGRAAAPDMLRGVLAFKPQVERAEWSVKPNGVVWKTEYGKEAFSVTFDTRALGTADWRSETVMDYYTETARLATPGHGETHTPVEIAAHPDTLKTRLRAAGIRDRVDAMRPGEFRDSMYTAVQEARVASPTLAVSLFSELKRIAGARKSAPLRVLDVSAYGGRAVAASALGLEYHGVDPDPALQPGYAELAADLRRLGRPAPVFSQTTLEAYRAPESGWFDIFTVSPPPWRAEPYGGAGAVDAQTHRRYNRFGDWLSEFACALPVMATEVVRKDGVFAFTALDRTAEGAKRSKAGRAGRPAPNSQIEYVEAILLTAEMCGMLFVGAIGLGPRNTPWWTFKVGKGQPAKIARAGQALWSKYPELFSRVAARVSGYTPPRGVRIVPEFPVSVLAEAVRLQLASTAAWAIARRIEALDGGDKPREYQAKLYTRVRAGFARWMMTAGADPQTKLIDPLFPAHVDPAGPRTVMVGNISYGDLVSLAVVETALTTEEYWIQPAASGYRTLTGVGVSGLSTACAVFAAYAQRTSEFQAADSGGGSTSISAREIGFLRWYIPICPESPAAQAPVAATRLVLAPQPPSGRAVELSALAVRYAALGARGHQFTRTLERSRDTLAAFGGSDSVLLDAFASPFNNCSLLADPAVSPAPFFGAFPDLEAAQGSLGSGLDVDALEAAVDRYTTPGNPVVFLANPVDTPAFTVMAVDTAEQVMLSSTAEPAPVFVMGFVVWEDTAAAELAALEAEPGTVALTALAAAAGNPGLTAVVASPLLQTGYVLSSRYESRPPADGEREYAGKPRGTRSVVAVLARDPLSTEYDLTRLAA